jgi:hypothetical protein
LVERQQNTRFGRLGATEAALTPLMDVVQWRFAGMMVFSLPCVDEQHVLGKHIELGVMGPPEQAGDAFVAIGEGLAASVARPGAELVR